MAIYLISSIAITISAYIFACKIFPSQPLAAALLQLCLVLLQITGIILILGIFKALNSWALLLLALVLPGLLIWLAVKKIHLSKPEPNQQYYLNSSGLMLISLMIVVSLIPFYSLMGELLLQIHVVHPLSWDVVSYHLPNVLDYIQTHSLWTVQGIFSPYPGGNELFQIWSFLPLKLDSVLGFTTLCLCMGFMLAATLILTELIPTKYSLVSGLWTVALWVACLSIPYFQNIWFDFGRNDLVVSFWLLVALWTLMRVAVHNNHASWWMLWCGICSGIAIGIKPNAAYYVLGLFLLYFCKFFPSPDPNHPFRSKLISVFSLWALPATVLGGFWYLRNLLINGTLFDRGLVEPGAKLTILRLLFDPRIYQPSEGSIFLLMALLPILIAVFFWFRKPELYPPQFKLLIGFNSIGIFAWMLTPFGAGYLAGDSFIVNLQIRFALAIVPTTIILFLYFAHQLIIRLILKFPRLNSGSAWIAKFHHHRPPRTAVLLGTFNLIGLLLLSLQLITYQPPIGLPGFDSILFSGNQNPSQIYRWVQQNVRDAKIYSIGLRPYGLYGFPFSNQVIYELGSSSWSYTSGLEVIQKFKPQFIAISLDPFTGQVSQDISYLLNQPQAYPVVYQDRLALVFKVQSTN
uniref:Glycosyltransferase RgtA/B/C/D-like domain-containing protein n=1 Tax=Cyanothece sp. (strain PCC 7425 / ATCC 29141) TaxID=395961 RepID=B8HW74_CYAP4